jgi:nucleotide-binding universal stress UspA family protein
MVNILVPTDLSDLSKVAADYAIKFANKLDTPVTLLHVVQVVAPVRVKLQKQLKALEHELISRSEQEMIRVMKPVTKNAKLSEPLHHHVVVGHPFDQTVVKESRKLRSGMIIMGTHGASGLKKVLIGSNTAAMIAASSIPVLVVPRDAAFKGFRNIVYATDMRNLKKELKILIPYAEIFGATIHVIHVASSGREVDPIEEKMAGIIDKCGYGEIVNIVLADTDVNDAIAQYASINKADLVAMFTHNPTFYEKLFDRSRTRKMAFHSKIPLLAFKGD